ncbi:MAG: hypothetical protein RLW62_07350, partial [Gammaproteobacteria bacterium]
MQDTDRVGAPACGVRAVSRRGRRARVLRALGTVTALVLFTLAAALWLLRSPWAEQAVRDALRERLGRDVRVAALDIAPGWPLVVSARDACIANPDWAHHRCLVAFDHLRLELDPLAVVRPGALIAHLRVAAPRVHLERTADGRTSWALASSDAAPGAADGDGAALPRPQALHIDDGRLTYRDAVRSIHADMQFAADATRAERTGQFSATATGAVGERAFALLVRSDAPLALGDAARALPLTVQLRAGDSALSVEGEVDALLRPRAADFRVRADGDDLQALAALA